MLKQTPCTVLLYLVNVISTGIYFTECTAHLLYSYFYKSENKFAQELSLWNVQIVYFMQNKKIILFDIKVYQMTGENIHVLSINRLNPFQICSCFCLAVVLYCFYMVYLKQFLCRTMFIQKCQQLLWYLWFFLAGIIPSMVCTHPSFIYDQHCVISAVTASLNAALYLSHCSMQLLFS
jgi:hypothetical protein